MTIQQYSLLTLLIGALTGCAAGFETDVSCKKVGGVPGCQSMDETRRIPTTPEAMTIASTPPVFTLLPRRTREGHPTRTEETVRKVVVFPFTSDDASAYIDTMDIYILLDESRWSGRPVQSVKKD